MKVYKKIKKLCLEYIVIFIVLFFITKISGGRMFSLMIPTPILTWKEMMPNIPSLLFFSLIGTFMVWWIERND